MARYQGVYTDPSGATVVLMQGDTQEAMRWLRRKSDEQGTPILGNAVCGMEGESWTIIKQD